MSMDAVSLAGVSATHNFFLSVIVIIQDEAPQLRDSLHRLSSVVKYRVSEYEIIVVDNGSKDETLEVLRQLTVQDGIPNIQVLALTKTVDFDTAVWAGMGNAIGDFVVVIDPATDDVDFLPTLLAEAGNGRDVVFATNMQQSRQSIAYRVCEITFDILFRWSTGVTSHDLPQFRIMSRQVVNYIMQHPVPAVAYRHLPATAGFSREHLSYSAPMKSVDKKRLLESIDRGTRLIVSTTRAPMRLVTALSLFGAAANIVYSMYVIVIALLKSNVAPGWITLSMQQSGMFFLISLVLFVLGEYILNVARLSSEGPPFHIAQEFRSTILTWHERLNIEDGQLKGRNLGGHMIRPPGKLESPSG